MGNSGIRRRSNCIMDPFDGIVSHSISLWCLRRTKTTKNKYKYKSISIYTSNYVVLCHGCSVCSSLSLSYLLFLLFLFFLFYLVILFSFSFLFIYFFFWQQIIHVGTHSYTKVTKIKLILNSPIYITVPL